MKIVFVGDGPVKTFDSFEEVPYKISGYTEDLSELREQGRCVHRAELDNQPEYEGWCGPMWDGGGFRYETWEVYDMLSR